MGRLTQALLTPRLRLRRWRPDDAAAMAAINSDPEVIRYLAPRATLTPDDAREFVARLMGDWERHGFGFWAVESREPRACGRLLGFAGLGHPTFIPALAAEVEIGWRLAREAWGRGLATEAASAALEDAFEGRGLRTLISIIHPENVRSQRVAVKLGMSPAGEVHNPLIGRRVEVWRIGRESWRGAARYGSAP